MAVEFSESVEVHASPERVGAVMCAVEDWPSWTASVTWVRRSGTGPLTVGETITLQQPKLPPSTWTVTRVEPTGFEWRSAQPGIRNVAGHWAEPAADGTSVARLTLSFAGPLSRITTLFYRNLIRRYMTMEGEGLRKRAEAGR